MQNIIPSPTLDAAIEAIANARGIDPAVAARPGPTRDQLRNEANFILYRATAGEVEARNVQTHADFTNRQIPPWATEDVRRPSQIVAKPLKRGPL